MLTNLNTQKNICPEQKEKQNLVEKFLPEDTPIVMLWLVKDRSELKPDQLPLPDNKRFPYKQRLLNWADNEPRRKIKLYYVSVDLTVQQVQKMHDLMDINRGGKNNIEVIDFNSMFKDKYDLKFLDDESINQQRPFAWKIDIMRLVILIEEEHAIYFDFDILPIESKKIGKVEMNDVGYKMAHYTSHTLNYAQLENSIIAVNSKGKHIVSAIYDYTKYFINHELYKYYGNHNDMVLNGDLDAVKYVYSKILEVDKGENNEYKQEQLLKYLESGKLNEELIQKFNFLFSKEDNESNADKRNEYFAFSGNVNITGDLSWRIDQKCLYEEKDKDPCIGTLTALGNILVPECLKSNEAKIPSSC